MFLVDAACRGPVPHCTARLWSECQIHIVIRLLLSSPLATAKGTVATDIHTPSENRLWVITSPNIPMSGRQFIENQPGLWVL